MYTKMMNALRALERNVNRSDLFSEVDKICAAYGTEFVAQHLRRPDFPNLYDALNS